jgi:hypothetical protein
METHAEISVKLVYNLLSTHPVLGCMFKQHFRKPNDLWLKCQPRRHYKHCGDGIPPAHRCHVIGGNGLQCPWKWSEHLTVIDQSGNKRHLFICTKHGGSFRKKVKFNDDTSSPPLQPLPFVVKYPTEETMKIIEQFLYWIENNKCILPGCTSSATYAAKQGPFADPVPSKYSKPVYCKKCSQKARGGGIYVAMLLNSSATDSRG